MPREKDNTTKQDSYAELFNTKKPKEIYDYLNEFVIGQDEAKKTLAVAIYDHYLTTLANLNGATPGTFKMVKGDKKNRTEISFEEWLNLDPSEMKKYKVEGDETYEENRNIAIEKSNIILLGNTGTGKTYMLKQIAKFLNIPCYIADTTKLTQAGYVGDDVETIILGLLREADLNVKKAQRGIIVLDEIDKIGRKSDNPSITRDVGGEGVQQALLKIVEGGAIGVPPNGGRKHPEQELVYIDTTNILFIGLGAFDGIDKIIEKRLNTNTVGFNRGHYSNNSGGDPLSHVTPNDLKSFGLIPELIGRFPVITHTNDLTKEDLVRIIKEPKNSLLKQKRKLMLISGVDVTFTDEAIDYIAETALATKTGARGLRGIMELVLRDITFEYADRNGESITIDKEYIKNIIDKRYGN